jgi:sec-independent protein translocase protein TatA
MNVPLLAVTLSAAHIALLVLFGILLFGKRLPEIARSVARALKEFQNGWKGMEEDVTTFLFRETEPSPGQNRPFQRPQRITEATPKFVETGDVKLNEPIA